MKYKVTTTWIVDVTEQEVEQAKKGYGKNVDPKQLATFKAMVKSIEVTMGEGTWDQWVSVYFDVTPMAN